MPIFGQVWLWSLAAFLLGALFCWLLVAYPARRRVGELQARLATGGGRPTDAQRGSDADRTRHDAVGGGFPSAPPALVPGFPDEYPYAESPDQAQSESLTRAYALPATRANEPDVDAAERGALQLPSVGGGPFAPPEPPQVDASETELADGGPEATRYINAVSGPLTEAYSQTDASPEVDPRTTQAGGRDWFAEEADQSEAGPPSQRGAAEQLVDDEDDDGGTVFTQRTRPIPAELIRRLDESDRGDTAETGEPEDSLVDDLDDEDFDAAPAIAHVDARTEVVAPVSVTDRAEPREAETPATDTPHEVESATADLQAAMVASTAQPQAAREQTRQVAVEPKVAHGMTVAPEGTQSLLPKRVPSKPTHQHPFGVKTTTPATVAASANSASSGASQDDHRVRSLFEPIVPAQDDTAVPPPPHRVHASGDRSGSPGPFGPGSAMPLPGGASPSPDFTIKASVTALRYCTPESPQFGRTVAEVWFRSAADAERVGFRPVGSV